MSRTPLAFAPDPTKWIDTSSASTKKKPSQRPLAGFRNNISTPPPSTIRRLRGRQQDETPLARQSHIAGYLTPPATTSAAKPRQRLERLRREVEDELRTSTLTAAQSNAAGVSTRRIEELWGLRDSEAGPSRQSPPRVRTDPMCREPSAAACSPVRKRPAPSQPIRSSLLPLQQPISPSLADLSSDPPAPLSGSPPPDRTPIPDHVLNLHKRLCHQDTVRKQKTRSPWRESRGDMSSPIRRPKAKEKPSPTKDVENRIRGIKQKGKPMGTGIKRGLVSLSDEDSEIPAKSRRPEEDFEPLKSLRPNAKSQKSQREDRGFVTGFASPRKKIRPAASKESITPSLPLPPARRPTSQSSRISPLVESPQKQLALEARLSSEGAHPPFTSSPSHAHPTTPHQPGSFTTPRKRSRHSPHHHHITPPKSRSPQQMHELNETLFAFPPPRQPRFEVEKPAVRREEKSKQWKPVDMDAETLMTWSLGSHGPPVPQASSSSDQPADRTPASPDPVEARLIEEEQGVFRKATKTNVAGTSERPEPTPIQRLKRRTSSSASETESLAPSVASQSFPNFVHSSPTKRSSRGLQKVQVQGHPYDGDLAERTQEADAPLMEGIVKSPSRQQSRSYAMKESLATSVQSQSFPNFVHSSPKHRSSESVLPPVEGRERSSVKEEPLELPQEAGEQIAGSETASPRKPRSPRSIATSEAKADNRWKGLQTGILSVPVTPGTPALSQSQRKKRKSDAAHDGAAQTKLAAFGFFQTPTQTERATRSAAAAFERRWEDEEDLDIDCDKGDDKVHQKNAETTSESHQHAGAPLASHSQKLGNVPRAPYHPSLRPAGIAELKKRERLQAASESSSPRDHWSISKSTRKSPRKPAANDLKEAPVPDLVRQGEPQPSSSDLTSLSSSSDEELFPGISGKGGTAEEWFDRIVDRRSSEFGSFTSI